MKSKTTMTASKDKFLEKRAEKLKVLDNTAKTCKQNRLSPTAEQLQEAVLIGYELLEEVHRNYVQGRLADLLEKATNLLVERTEPEKEDG